MRWIKLGAGGPNGSGASPSQARMDIAAARGQSGGMPLHRFLAAQAPVYATVLAELHAGHKQSHWMWFIFPQLAALGRSPMAKFYGLAGVDEARAYLRHPLLGTRLIECTGLVNAVTGRSAHEIFGAPDDLKFRSCVTLFRLAGGGEVFGKALERYYGGVEDEATVRLVGGES